MNINNGLVLRSAGLHPTQCTYCQLDPYTGEHICDCATQEYLASIGYGSPQQILVSATTCNCPQCPYQIYLGGGVGLLNGGLQVAGASPANLSMGFGMNGGMLMNPALGMGAFQMNPLALQGMSQFGAAGLGAAGALGLLGQGFGAQRMLTYPMGGMNRRGFGRGVTNRLGSSPFYSGRWGRCGP